MRAVTAAVVLFACVGVLPGVRADDEPPRSSEVPECVQYWGEVRYGALGYNHIVHIANECDRDAECQVSTNVNPEWQEVTVPAGEKEEVVTYIASPSREFTPYVRCEL